MDYLISVKVTDNCKLHDNGIDGVWRTIEIPVHEASGESEAKKKALSIVAEKQEGIHRAVNEPYYPAQKIVGSERILG